MSGYTKILCAAAVLCVFDDVSAAPAATAETLQQAWVSALQADQRLAAARAQRDGAGFALQGAKAERLPAVALMTSAIQVDDAPRFAFGETFISPQLFSGDNVLSASTQLRLPLYTSGAVRHEVAAARSALDASGRQVQTIEQDVKLQVADAYVRVLRAERALTVAESIAASLTAHTQDAKNRFEHGAVAKNDFLSASVSLADARQTVLQLSNALEIAQAIYNRRLGRALTDAVKLESKVSSPATHVEDDTLESLIETALERRPELHALSAQVRVFEKQSAAVLARSRPQLGLTGGYSYFENNFLDDDEFWWVGIGMTWNLFDSGRTRSRAASAQSQATALARQRSDMASVIALQVRQEWLQWQEAKHRVKVTVTAIEQSAENLRVARDRYRAGAGTNTEVLDAEALRALTLNNRDNAIFDTSLARLRLAHAIGGL
jgi:outer membrane protein TolC